MFANVGTSAVGFVAGAGATNGSGGETRQKETRQGSFPEAANLPFSQAVRVGDIWYLSGAVGVVPGKTELAPGGFGSGSQANNGKHWYYLAVEWLKFR